MGIRSMVCSKDFSRKRISIHRERHRNKEHRRVAMLPVLSTNSNSRKPTYCNLCYHDYKYSSSLIQHRRKVHKSEEEIKTFDDIELSEELLKFHCKLCDKKFLTENILSHHTLYRHREEKKEEVSCDYCKRVFKWKNRRNLKKHIRDVHKVDDNTEDSN